MLNPLEKQLRDALAGVAICANAGLFKQFEGEPWLAKVHEAIAKADESAVVDPLEQRIRDLAFELWDDDECTVESDTLVAISEEDGAAWIKVWQLMSADTLREHGIETPGMDSEETEAEGTAGA